MNFILPVQALTDEGVEFAIIGGWSAIMHGSAHLTGDLDWCYSPNPDNLRRLAQRAGSVPSPTWRLSARTPFRLG
jgi:hypothetical protein